MLQKQDATVCTMHRGPDAMLLRMWILIFTSVISLGAATSISQYGITWTFDKDYEIGQYCSGDYWVKGPVTIISIENDWHTHGLLPEEGHDGSMLNPNAAGRQGYDKRLKNYDAKLNISYRNGKKISVDNPLLVENNSTLLSSISWLCKSDKEKEPGCPRVNGGTKAPRPVLRDIAVLTVVAEIPEEGSFRPAYCAEDKSVKFNVKQLKKELLLKLKAPDSAPKLSDLAKRVQRPWIDHVHQYLGAMTHPTNNMPEYGREVSTLIGVMGLALHLDVPMTEKEKLLIGYVQLGIDLAGIADAGGSWPSNGGHLMGRKWPILFAGLLLDDKHMKNVGQWKTGFQEDLDTFYVSQADIDMTHSAKWKPDKRAQKLPYEKEHLGLPEWGIRHVKDPWADNLHWSATYRSINQQSYPGFVLCAHLMGQRKAWNHEPLFDFIDRSIHFGAHNNGPGTKRYAIYTFGGKFIHDMWKMYRSQYGCVWNPAKEDVYSTGALHCDDCKFHCTKKE